jgi:hypothetical protein
MDIMRSFIGIDYFKVKEVTDDAIFIGDAIAAMHIPCHSSDIEGFTTRIPFHNRGDFWGSGSLIFHSS